MKKSLMLSLLGLFDELLDTSFFLSDKKLEKLMYRKKLKILTNDKFNPSTMILKINPKIMFKNLKYRKYYNSKNLSVIK